MWAAEVCIWQKKKKTELGIDTLDAAQTEKPVYVCRQPINQFRDNHRELKYLESQGDVPESC